MSSQVAKDDHHASTVVEGELELTHDLYCLRADLLTRGFQCHRSIYVGIVHCLKSEKESFVSQRYKQYCAKTTWYLILNLIWAHKSIQPIVETTHRSIMKLQLLASAALALLAAVPGAVSEVSTHHMVMNTNLFVSLYLLVSIN